VFTDSDAKLTVMYENEGKLESGIYPIRPISRVEVEKYEIAGKKAYIHDDENADF
jgi:hypothetical protein